MKVVFLQAASPSGSIQTKFTPWQSANGGSLVPPIPPAHVLSQHQHLQLRQHPQQQQQAYQFQHQHPPYVREVYNGQQLQRSQVPPSTLVPPSVQSTSSSPVSFRAQPTNQYFHPLARQKKLPDNVLLIPLRFRKRWRKIDTTTYDEAFAAIKLADDFIREAEEERARKVFEILDVDEGLRIVGDLPDFDDDPISRSKLNKNELEKNDLEKKITNTSRKDSRARFLVETVDILDEECGDIEGDVDDIISMDMDIDVTTESPLSSPAPPYRYPMVCQSKGVSPCYRATESGSNNHAKYTPYV